MGGRIQARWMNNNGWTSDFDDLVYDDDDDDEDDADAFKMPPGKTLTVTDLSGCEQRQFSLGYDVVLSSFAGKMGFEEVTDWEYYDNPGEEERNVVQPPPFDPSKPKRTRSSSGSVVRIFRGEFGGRLASTIRSKGLDVRLLFKEFSGKEAMDLARAEMSAVSAMQSSICSQANDAAKRGDWATSAASRYLMARVNGSTRDDDTNLLQLMTLLKEKSKETSFVSILGELNLSEMLDDEGMDPNEWYRAMGVPPPKPGSIWIVYEYTGLSTLAGYARPPLARLESEPPRRGPFGNIMAPPPLPPWRERSRYVVQGILKGCLEAVANLHDSNLCHRSIGRNSIILGSVGMDKLEASSIYSIVPSRLRIKLADFGFSGSFDEFDEAFCARARGFKLYNIKAGVPSVDAIRFAMAEDLHALGFVFLGTLLTSLAEIPTSTYQTPATDEDSLQRLLVEIFSKDMDEFREYCDAEEIWSNVVDLLDENDGAGWDLLRALCFARETAAENPNQFQTARELLSNPLFKGQR
eukprot:scaffold3150_cov51-Attheya_sp.AAC.21